MAESKVEFSPPGGFVLPENVGQDGTFDVVCTIKVDEGGKLCLKKIGDTPMPGYEDDKDGGSKLDYRDYSRGMMSQMGGQQPQQ